MFNSPCFLSASAAAAERLQAAYGGEYRNLVHFEGDHNHQRPQFFYDSVVIFFYQQLRLDDVLVGAKPVSGFDGGGGVANKHAWYRVRGLMGFGLHTS